MKQLFSKASLIAIAFLIGCSGTDIVQKQYDKLSFPELRNYKAPEVETFTSANGIRFYILENKELPLISLSLTVRGGDIQTQADKVGLANILGTVMRSGGTEKYPADDLNELLENKAASIETSMGFNSGSASMSVLKEDFDSTLPVFLDVLMNPAFPEEKIELSKKQSKSGISRRNDDAQGIASREFSHLIYGKSSVYSREVEYASIDAITREDLVNYHDKVFVGSNMYVGVIGDFNAKEMKAKLTEAFGSIPTGTENKIDYPAVQYSFKNSINFINKEDVNQSAVLLGHIGGKRNEDYAALQLMNEILSGGFSGRLMQIVRTDLGLAYGVSGSYSQGINYDGVFNAGVRTKSESTADAISAVIDQIKRLTVEPVSATELKDAKERILNSTIFRYDSRSKILNQRISNEFNGLPANYFEKYIEQVKKTTASDIQRVAKKYLHPDKLEILVVGNKKELGDQLNRFGTVNTIDITIPVPGMETGAIKGDAAQAKVVLDKMAKTLGLNKKYDGYISDSEAEILANGMKTGSNIDVTFSTNSALLDLDTPQGPMTISISGNEGFLSMGPMQQPLPAPAVKQIRDQVHRSYERLIGVPDDYTFVYTGTETVEGVEYDVIEVTSDPKFTLLIDTKTSLPVYLRFSALNPMSGDVVKSTLHNTDWKTVNGVSFPSKVTIYDGDKKSSISTFKTFKLK